jgi:hypothetical protein
MSQINKFMHVSRETHLNVIERILQYLKGTIGKRILMINNNSNNIYMVISMQIGLEVSSIMNY